MTPPDELLGHVDAYLAFADAWQPFELLTESMVGNRRYRYMGTLDFVGKLGDGKTWLLDFKTNRSGVYIESALQLAAYRHAEWYLDADGNEQPMPEVDECGVLWLRADGFDLYPIDASEQTFRKFLYAQQVARFITAPKEAVIGESLVRARGRGMSVVPYEPRLRWSGYGIPPSSWRTRSAALISCPSACAAIPPQSRRRCSTATRSASGRCRAWRKSP